MARMFGTIVQYWPLEKKQDSTQVAYDNEDDVYAFKLLEDLESGELIIL